MSVLKRLLSLIILSVATMAAMACTSVIISGNATADGKPLMLKHRDSDCLLTRMEYYRGQRYAFIGLVNETTKTGEVWAGTNEAGLCIMNTAVYNLKDDKVHESKMDKEGELMFAALGWCATVEDFRWMLKNLAKPFGVEACFGVIDAQGGASYFEVNNHTWWEYNVNDEPAGYRVQTNFAFAGRKEDYRGLERYQTASDIMSEYAAEHPVGQMDINHSFLLNHISRSYRHHLLGITDENFCTPSGIAVDQDFIPRANTSAAIVFEGVKKGDNPLKTIMWTALGHPATAVAFPLMVAGENKLPPYLLHDGKEGYCRASHMADELKNTYVFTFNISNGNRYFHLDAIQRGTEGKPALKTCAQQAEQKIDASFYTLMNLSKSSSPCTRIMKICLRAGIQKVS